MVECIFVVFLGVFLATAKFILWALGSSAHKAIKF